MQLPFNYKRDFLPGIPVWLGQKKTHTVCRHQQSRERLILKKKKNTIPETLCTMNVMHVFIPCGFYSICHPRL